jgi:hypothetical protein
VVFGCLEHVFNAHNFRVLLLRDFILPLFDWKLGLVCCYFSLLQQIEGRSRISSTCLLDFPQHNYFRNSGNLLDLGFSNCTDLSVNHDVHVLVSPDTTLL